MFPLTPTPGPSPEFEGGEKYAVFKSLSTLERGLG